MHNHVLMVWKTDGRLPWNLINSKVSSFFFVKQVFEFTREYCGCIDKGLTYGYTQLECESLQSEVCTSEARSGDVLKISK